MLALDGVYVRAAQSDELVFHALAAPSADEVTDVATRTAVRVQKVLARHGRTLDGAGERDAVEPVGEQLAGFELLYSTGPGEPRRRAFVRQLRLGDDASNAAGICAGPSTRVRCAAAFDRCDLARAEPWSSGHVRLPDVIARTIRVLDLKDAAEEDARSWHDTTPAERLAGVEAIRRATFALYGAAVPGLERVLEIADAPSSQVPPDRWPRDIDSRPASPHRRSGPPDRADEGQRRTRARDAR